MRKRRTVQKCGVVFAVPARPSMPPLYILLAHMAIPVIIIHSTTFLCDNPMQSNADIFTHPHSNQVIIICLMYQLAPTWWESIPLWIVGNPKHVWESKADILPTSKRKYNSITSYSLHLHIHFIVYILC